MEHRGASGEQRGEVRVVGKFSSTRNVRFTCKILLFTLDYSDEIFTEVRSAMPSLTPATHGLKGEECSKELEAC